MHFLRHPFPQAARRPNMIAVSSDARDNPPGITKIIGIGQTLRGDDAVGFAAVSLWQKTFQTSAGQSDIIVELAELPGIGLLSLLEGASKAILVDAVRSGAEPGTIYTIPANQLDSFELGARSAHGWGVAETLSLGRELDLAELPAELILVGIEAGQTGMGEDLSPQVKLALPRVATLIEQIVSGEAGSVYHQSRSSRTSPK
jgi:hydrogenase maturation protease